MSPRLSKRKANKADTLTVTLRLLILMNIREKLYSALLQKPFNSQTSFSQVLRQAEIVCQGVKFLPAVLGGGEMGSM